MDSSAEWVRQWSKRRLVGAKHDVRKGIQFLQPESVEQSMMGDAENQFVGQDGELDPPGEQVMNNLFKGVVEMMAKIKRVILVLLP